MSTGEVYSPGLEGVVAGETAVSTIVDGLSYRGYIVTELAEKSTFDEVAYLLLHGDLPTAAQRTDFNKRVADASRMPDALLDLFRALPRTRRRWTCSERPSAPWPISILKLRICRRRRVYARRSGCSARFPPPSPPTGG